MLPPITLLSASPASPSTNITTPAGDLLQLSLDPSAGSITVTYKNSTLVVDGASVGFNSSATIVIGLEDPALSMTDGECGRRSRPVRKGNLQSEQRNEMPTNAAHSSLQALEMRVFMQSDGYGIWLARTFDVCMQDG